ncbi:MAG: tetratricopeptide repeat protein [Leptospiraceae bacterium]
MDRERQILERVLSLKQVIREERGGPVDMHELGICYFYLENYERCLETLEGLIDQYSNYVDIGRVQALRVFAKIQLEQWEEARFILMDRLKVETTDETLMGMLAYVYEREGRLKDAIAQHRRVLQVNPDNVNSLNSLGYLITLYGKPEEMDEAFRCLKRAMETNPDNPAYLDSFGVFLNRKGNKDSARKALSKALKKDPDNSVILEHLKEVLEV